MKLYKYVPEKVVAESIAKGVFRFYELTKYIAIEDDTGRADASECSVNFPRHEWTNEPEKLPVIYIGDIKLQYHCVSPSKDHIAQYFVFCSSYERTDEAILDTNFLVEFSSDVFDIFQNVLKEYEFNLQNDKLKIFTHGEVDYYDLNNPPELRLKSTWEEVYLKHQDYAYQNEYRAALCITDTMFEIVNDESMHLEIEITDQKGEPVDFNLVVDIHGGVDPSGWRYIELDISEFSNNVGVRNEVIDLRLGEIAC